MTTLSNTYRYTVFQKAARALGQALVNWAEHTAQRSARLRRDPDVLVRRAQQRREADARRDAAIEALYLGPRQF